MARRRGASLVVMVLAATGCGSDPAGPGTEDPPELALELVADGLDDPVWLTWAPGDETRLFVLEKPGRVRVIRNGTLLPDPFLDIESVTTSGGERGLLGLAFHPDYATNGYVFVDHTDSNGDTRVLRYMRGASADLADPASLSIVLEVDQPATNHNGGQIAFGPDGMLYVGLGDGGGGGDPDGNGQDPRTLLGSILRIDVDALPYTVPADNPFVGDTTGADETWVWGLRNPWRFSFDRLTGDLWIGDVGQNAMEEISFQSASSAGGENYGWNVLEGSSCYPSGPCDSTGTVLPVHEYPHPDGCSVTGGYVYRGSAVPGLSGRYLFGDYCGGWIRSLGWSGSAVTDEIDHTAETGTVPQLVSFGEGPDGELYVIGLGGTVWRIVPGDG